MKNTTLYLTAILLLVLSNALLSQKKSQVELKKTYENAGLTANARFTAMEEAGYYYLHARPDSAVLLGKSMAKLAKNSHKPELEYKAFVFLGNAETELGDYGHALEYYTEAYQKASGLNDEIKLATVLQNEALVYYQLGNTPKALEHYLKALKYAEKTRDVKQEAGIYSNLGMVYTSEKDYPKALSYYSKALNAASKINNEQLIGTIHANVGSLYVYQENYDRAMPEFEKALAIALNTNNKLQQANLCYELALVHSYKSNHSKAKEYAAKGLDHSTEMDDTDLICKGNKVMSNVLYRMAKYRDAEQYGRTAMDCARERGDVRLIRDVALLMGQIASKNGNSRAELEYTKLYHMVNDSIVAKETTRAKIEEQLKHEFEKKAMADSLKLIEMRKLDQQKREAQRTAPGQGMNTLLILLGATGLIVLIIVLLIRKNK
jgi:adenylate cyclase